MNENEKLIEVAIPRPLTNLFTYKISCDLHAQIKKGSFVIVPFGKSKQLHAYVISDEKEEVKLPEGVSSGMLKSVISVGAVEHSLPGDILELCRFSKNYYGAPYGEVLNAAAPAVALGLKSKKEKKNFEKSNSKQSKITLNDEQSESFNYLSELYKNCETSNDSNVALMKGVTGSGKTEVYIELAKKVLNDGKSVLFLVPEISLTPQLHERVQIGLGEKVALWHSSVSVQKRRDQWMDMRQGNLRVALGARSSVFSPLQNLGLIIVDEEHDSSYKQEEKFRYNARDLAIYRSKINKALCVLGSATPSFESLQNVLINKYAYTEIKKKFYSGLKSSSIEVVQLGNETHVEGVQTLIAENTLSAIKEELSAGNQVMIFLNRRGFANFLLCQDCGEVKGCPHCSISLTLHKKINTLICHYCGHSERVILECLKCSSKNLLPVGAGTEALEDDFNVLLPDAKIIRLDRDTVTSHTRLEKIIHSFKSGESNVLLGTQMLVKGHDFPGVTLVVVIFADGLLKWPDFRAYEKAYQVLTQISGRAGRAQKKGKVIIQTYMDENPVLDVLKGIKTEKEFIQEELSMRKALNYPPFSRLVKLRFEGKSTEESMSKAEYYRSLVASEEVEVLGPSEAFLAKLKGVYRADLLLKSNDLVLLHKELSRISREWNKREKKALWIDVDPQQF